VGVGLIEQQMASLGTEQGEIVHREIEMWCLDASWAAFRRGYDVYMT